MTPQLTLKEIADKAEGYADALRDADSLRFALRNMAMLLREHLAPSAPPAAETRPDSLQAGVCDVCKIQSAWKGAHCYRAPWCTAPAAAETERAPAPKVQRREDTPETKAFWESAERTGAVVETWPAWKRAGINVATERAPAEAPPIEEPPEEARPPANTPHDLNCQCDSFVEGGAELKTLPCPAMFNAWDPRPSFRGWRVARRTEGSASTGIRVFYRWAPAAAPGKDGES